MGKGTTTSISVQQLIANAQQPKMPPCTTSELSENETQQEEADEAMTPGTVPSGPGKKPVGY